MPDWVKADKGIRYKLGSVRKSKVRPNKYYVLRFTVDGKSYQEALAGISWNYLSKSTLLSWQN